MTFINADSKLKSLGLLACGVLHAIEPLNSFLASLCKFTIVLPTDAERRSSLAQSPVSKRSEVQVDQKDVIVLTPKNVQALRTLFNIVHRLHNVLGPSWVLVLETLAALDRAIHSPHATTQEVATTVPKLTREPSRQYADFSILSSLNSQGEALVMGYDDMGYELWKPNLRAIMEHDMNEVSVGRKTKAEVLETCLQQMKACFLDARVKKSKLLEAMTIFFERSNNTDEGENQTAGEIVRQCNLCNESDMALRKNRDGNFMVRCMNYPQCRNAVWLPGPTLEASITTNAQSTKYFFKFRQIGIPPGFDVNHLGCIGGCDDILKQLIDICGTGSRSQARRAPDVVPSNNIRGSNTRQSNACIHCQQQGHASANCPSRVSASRNSRPTGTNPRNGTDSYMIF